MADKTPNNPKITDPDKDPHVTTLKDMPGAIPNELPHHTSFFDKHKFIETNATLLLILSFLVVTIGGLVQIVPLFYLEGTIEEVEGMRPYTPLAHGPRHLCPRRLLCLPQPDDPPDARRGRTLRSLQPRG